jgi:hypothetical protein
MDDFNPLDALVDEITLMHSLITIGSNVTADMC